MTSQSVADTTGSADTTGNTENLANWSSAYHLNLLRPRHDDAQPFTDHTWTTSSRDALANGNLFFTHDRFSPDARRMEALRSLVDRIKTRQPEASTAAVSGMQKWEGRVLEVDEDYFTVELVPTSGPGTEVLADFAIDLMSEDDKVQAGDVVYVTVRTVEGVGGRTRTSAVRLRRLGTWTETEVAGQQERARQRLSRLASRIV